MKLNKTIFESVIKSLGYDVEPEYKFCPTRKFRADWKVSKYNSSCLVEYEGIYSTKSRHTGVKGYSKDCEKYNLAQIEGYPILRYTADNFDNVINDLEKVLIK
jgi:hypothetical protein